MDVAKEAQVSIATASRVLNGSTRKVRNQSYVKVMEAATKLNYRPNAYAQAVAKGTAPNIVLLVSDISDPYFASVSQGVVKAAAEQGVIAAQAIADLLTAIVAVILFVVMLPELRSRKAR